MDGLFTKIYKTMILVKRILEGNAIHKKNAKLPRYGLEG